MRRPGSNETWPSTLKAQSGRPYFDRPAKKVWRAWNNNGSNSYIRNSPGRSSRGKDSRKVGTAETKLARVLTIGLFIPCLRVNELVSYESITALPTDGDARENGIL